MRLLAIPCWMQKSAPPDQVVRNFIDDVFVPGVVLHGLWRSLHVHHADTRLGLCRNFTHRGVARQPGDIVNDFRPSLDCRLSDQRFAGVDADRNAQLSNESCDHGYDSRKFIIGRNRFAFGASALATDVNDVGPVGLHPPCSGNGVFVTSMLATIGKTIRRDVENAHHQRTGIKTQLSVSQIPSGSPIDLWRDAIAHQRISI